MINRRKKPNSEAEHVVDLVSTAGDTDYIIDGVIYKHSPVASVIVTAEADLATLDDYEVGTIAYTAGFAKMWQLDASGDWISII